MTTLGKMILLIALFLHLLCFSEEEENPIIFHHVNVITGDLNLAIQETTVEGAVPLTIQRSYTSAGALERDGNDSDLYLKNLHHGFLIQGGWSFFSHAYLLFIPAQIDHSSIAHVADRSGNVTTYEYVKSENEWSVLQPRALNTKAFGKISSKNNTSLCVLKIKSATGEAFLTLADGTKCYYKGPSRKERKKKDEHGIAFFYLQKEELPTKQHIVYDYDRKDRLCKVRMMNSKETKTYSSCDFALDKPRTPYRFSLSTSDGKSFDYQFKDINHRDYLIESKSSFGLSQGYDYTKDRRGLGARVSEIRLDDLVQYRISYYSMTDKEKDKFYRDPKSKPFRTDKVEKVEAPFGPAGEYIPIATFFYEDGLTKVKDAEGLWTHYHFENGKPTLIIYHDDTGAKASYMKFLWQSDQMVAKMKLDKDKSPIFSKTFVYDDHGNITKETFWGNISGKAKGPFLEGPLGMLIDAEFTSKNFRYDTERQRLLEEREDSGLSYQFTYLDETSLLSKKLTLFKDKILLREFYDYDDDYLPSQTICDDGTGSDESDLSDVTERKITRYKRDSKTCQIIEVSELCVDLETMHEQLIQKKELLYGTQKKPIIESIFDMSGTLKYSIKNQYNSQGLLIEQTNALGAKNSFQYDNKGRITFSKIAGQLAKKFFYDKASRLCRQEEIDNKGLHHVTTMSYDTKGRLLKQVDPLGHAVMQEYDCFGRCQCSKTSAIENSDSTFYVPTVYFSYDADGNLSSTQNPQNDASYTEYNSLRKPILIKGADGSITEHRYTLSGDLAMTLHPDGTKEVYAYDPLKRMTSKQVISFDEEVLLQESWSYSSLHLLSYTDPLGLTTEYSYDNAGRLTKENAEGRARRYEYDGLGYLERRYEEDVCHVEIHNNGGLVTESWTESPLFPMENWTAFDYDDEGYKIAAYRLCSSGKTKDIFSYDERLRLSSHTNPLGQTWSYTYTDEMSDKAGQRISQKVTTDPMGYLLVETFDAQGRLRSLAKEDGTKRVHSKEEIFYDKAGNKQLHKSYVYHDGILQKTHSITWKYDPCGRVIEENEADEKITSFTYDSLGRLIKKRLNSGLELYFSYDGLGRMTEQYSSDGTINYSYHYFKGYGPVFAVDELTGHTIERHYDLFGNVTEESSSDGICYSWEYDKKGRCTKVTLPDTSSILYEYKGQHMTRVDRCGHHFAYHHNYDTFDRNGHVEKEQLIKGFGSQLSSRDALERLCHFSSSLHTCSIDFDCLGRVSEKRDTIGGNKTYCYDALGQIKKENNQLYDFDSLGNPAAAILGPCNELYAIDTAQLSYDKEGKVIEKKQTDGSRHLHYDALGRLIMIEEENKDSITLFYDALGRLSKKTVAESEIHYLFDNNIEIGAIDSSGIITELKILGLGTKEDVGAAVAIELYGKTYLPLHDTAGNIIAIADESGDIAERYAYDVFGKEETSLSYINPWRFCSKREVGHFIFFGLRFYDPEIGRWLTPDPAGYVDGANLYLFVMNAPTNRLDLFGLSADPLYPFPDIKMEAPLPTILASPTFSSVQSFKGSIDGVEVDWLIKGGNWSKLSFSSEELSSGKINLFHHFHEVLPSEGKMIGLVSFQNGIQTTLSEASEMVNKVSSWSPENTLVVSLYNPTGGLISDVAGASQEIWQWKETQISALTRQYFTAMSTTLCKINPDAFWLHIAHSRGGGIATRAIEGMSEEQKESMQKNFLYLGVAPSIPMPRQFCAQSMNVYSENDHITGRFGRKLINHPDYNIEIVKCITPLQERPFSILFADHAFLGRTYQDRTKDTIQLFNKNINELNENMR